LDYIVQIAEELAGKLQQADKAALIHILKHYALYHGDIRADLELRLSSPEGVLEAALHRIRASFKPCYRRGKHYVKYYDVYEALFGANAVLLVVEDGSTGIQPRERLLMCFAVLEEMGRVYNDVEDFSHVGMAVDDAIQHVAKVAAKLPAAELPALLGEHLQRGRALYDAWPNWKDDLLKAIGPLLGE